MEVVRGKEIFEMSPVREEVASVEVEEDWFDVQFADVKDGVVDHEPETGLVRDAKRSRTSLPLEEFQWERPRAMRIKPETKVMVLWLVLVAFLVALIVAVITIGVLGSR